MNPIVADAPALTPAAKTYIAGLRQLANVLEANPQIADGFYNTEPYNAVGIYIHADGLEELVSLTRSAGGRWSKKADENDSDFHLIREFGPHRIIAYTSRAEVCERVVTTETVTREVPDPALVAEIPMVTVTEEVEHVSWVCPDSLLRDLGGES